MNDLESNKAGKLKMYGIDTIKPVAQRLVGSILMGRGKTEWAIDQLLQALVEGCPYCRGVIHLHNGVIDHKVPIGGAVRRQNASSAAKRHADRPDNLHIICIPCNDLKGDFTHEEFKELRAFLAGKEQLEAKLRRRLMHAKTFWKQQRVTQQLKGHKGPPRRKRFNGSF